MLILSECQPKGIQKILHLTLCNGSQSTKKKKKKKDSILKHCIKLSLCFDHKVHVKLKKSINTHYVYVKLWEEL